MVDFEAGTTLQITQFTCLKSSGQFWLTREKNLCKWKDAAEDRGDAGVRSQIRSTTEATEKLQFLLGDLGSG